MSVKFSINTLNNKYLPRDTFNLLTTLSSFSEENNFFYLFNLPRIINRKIRVNEDVEKFRWRGFFLNQIQARINKIIEVLQKSGCNSKTLIARCPWRLSIGLGASHPQETSMTLHHVYGIPYIPGSAIKGITRHWAVLRFAKKDKKENENFEKSIERVAKALEEGQNLEIEVNGIKFSDLIEIFGTQKQAGKVIFMDAYPIENINLKIDIVNVHYPEYYSKNIPPADWQNPKPIKFLTVENTKFEFVLLGRIEELVNIALNLLKEALKNHGIGAKTSLGYGILEEVRV